MLPALYRRYFFETHRILNASGKPPKPSHNSPISSIFRRKESLNFCPDSIILFSERFVNELFVNNLSKSSPHTENSRIFSSVFARAERPFFRCLTPVRRSVCTQTGRCRPRANFHKNFKSTVFFVRQTAKTPPPGRAKRCVFCISLSIIVEYRRFFLPENCTKCANRRCGMAISPAFQTISACSLSKFAHIFRSFPDNRCRIRLLSTVRSLFLSIFKIVRTPGVLYTDCNVQLDKEK